MMCKTTDELATVIIGLPYGQMMEVAAAFSQMVEDADVRKPPKTAEDFASLLWDWAEAEREK